MSAVFLDLAQPVVAVFGLDAFGPELFFTRWRRIARGAGRFELGAAAVQKDVAEAFHDVTLILEWMIGSMTLGLGRHSLAGLLSLSEDRVWGRIGK